MKEKQIKINGYPLSGDLVVDDPDCKRKIMGMDIKCIKTTRQLSNFIKKHPEGIFIMGYGISFFDDPVPVPRHMIVFDEDGNADIRFRERAEEIEKMLIHIDDLSEAGQKAFYDIKDGEAS